MPTNELENIMRSIVEGLPTQVNADKTGFITAPAGDERALPERAAAQAYAAEAIERLLQPMRPQSAPLREATVDGGRLAAEIEQLRRAVTQNTATTQTANIGASRNTEPDNDNSVASTVLKTLALGSGIGPLATGLISLFSSRSQETEIPVSIFEPPTSISVEAGLNGDRQFAPISYGSDRLPRPITNTNASAPPLQQIQINVQAMDSRSFLDHSDDIAKAVREAMLHSHALNDVVSEL